MKNAHERFGWCEFTRELKDSRARVRLRMNRLVAEIERNGRSGKAHLISLIGGESDVGAAWAAVLSNQQFAVEGLEIGPVDLQLGEKAECFRGNLPLPGRRAVRHLVAVSAEMAATRLGGGIAGERTILSESDPMFIFYRLSEHFGLPVAPEWAAWFSRELRRRRAITRLAGIGCNPVSIAGTKDQFLEWISQGLKRDLIHFRATNGTIHWSSMPAFPTTIITPTAL